MSSITIGKAALINFISRYSNIFIQLIINSILARLLTPEDYGVIAVINVFIAFFTMLADMGIGPAIIQNKELKDKDISSIFKFTIFTGILIAIIFSVFSYPISLFYGDRIYIKLCSLLSLSILFSVFNIVPNALLLKQKRFKLLGIRTVVINIIIGILTILLAFIGFKYYALVINSILTALLTFLFNFKSCKINIIKGYDKESIQKIRNYSSYQFGFSFMNYFSRNLDNLLIGKVIGSSQLGFYEKAYKLMLYPVQNLTYVISPVLHPILSEYQDDREYIYNKYLSVVRVLSILGLFFGTVCFFISREIILIFFGERWVNSIETFKILSISIWPQVVTSSSGTMFQATGETKQLFKNGIITTTISIVLLALSLIFKRIEYVAIGVVISYWLSFWVTYLRLNKNVFNKSFLSFLLIFKNHVIIAIFIVLAMNIVKIHIDNIWISVVIKTLIGLVAYLIGIIITKEYKYYTKLKWRK